MEKIHQIVENYRAYVIPHFTEIFATMLDVMDFELYQDEDGYALSDKQGGNFGDIESDRFTTAKQIIDRLDVYLNDYYFDDLTEAAENYPYFADHDIPDTAEGWNVLRLFAPIELKPFIAEYSHEFDVMELVVNGYKYVDLCRIISGN